MNENIIIPSGALASLSAYSDRTTGVLSPLNSAEEKRIDAREALTGQNLLKNGVPDQSLKITAGILSEAAFMISLKRVSTEGVFEYNVYCDSADEKSGVLSRGADYVISYPPRTPDIVNYISGFSGTGTSRVLEREIETTCDEAVLLISLIDLFRGEIMLSAVRGTGLSYSGHDLPEVVSQIDKDSADFRNLKNIYSVNFKKTGKTAIEPLKMAARSLAGKKLVEEKDGRLMLAGDALMLAAKSIYPDSIYSCSSYASLPGGEILSNRVVFVQYGVNSVLMIEAPFENRIVFRSVSSYEMVSFIGRYLSDFSMIKNAVENQVQPATVGPRPQVFHSETPSVAGINAQASDAEPETTPVKARQQEVPEKQTTRRKKGKVPALVKALVALILIAGGISAFYFTAGAGLIAEYLLSGSSGKGGLVHEIYTVSGHLVRQMKKYKVTPEELRDVVEGISYFEVVEIAEEISGTGTGGKYRAFDLFVSKLDSDTINVKGIRAGLVAVVPPKEFENAFKEIEKRSGPLLFAALPVLKQLTIKSIEKQGGIK